MTLTGAWPVPEAKPPSYDPTAIDQTLPPHPTVDPYLGVCRNSLEINILNGAGQPPYQTLRQGARRLPAIEMSLKWDPPKIHMGVC
jgi:hypothetical protein